MTSAAPDLPPTSVDDVIACVRERVRPLEPESVALETAAGRVLREPVRAPEDQPPFDRSAMDGYAVRLDDDATTFRVVDRIRAGDWKPRELRPGEAVQIATGGALPGGGLRVVIKEDTRIEGNRLTVLRRSRERFVRFRGEDARAGQVLVAPGTRLTPGALGLLASLGHTRPVTTRLPRVLHLVTGNEIVPPDHAPARGQVRDSNSLLVRAFLGQWGIAPRQLRVPEDAEAAKSEIRNPKSDSESADLLLISGGASVGPHDFSAALLEELGYTLHVRRTTTRPGKPMLFGARGRALAFGLPGNPLAHFVCLNLYVRQALEGFSGAAERSGFLPGRLAEAFATKPNPRETLWPARLRLAGDGARLAPLAWRSSGDLTALAVANALVRIPPRAGALPAGAAVQFLATSPDV